MAPPALTISSSQRMHQSTANHNHSSTSIHSILAELHATLVQKHLNDEHVTRLLHIARLTLPVVLARLHPTGLPLLPCKRRKSPNSAKALSLPSYIARSGHHDHDRSNASLRSTINISQISSHPCLQLSPSSLQSIPPTEPFALYFLLCDLFDTFDISISSSDVFLKHGVSWSLLKQQKSILQLSALHPSSSLKLSFTTPSLPESAFKRFCPHLTTSPLPSDTELSSNATFSNAHPSQSADEAETSLVPKVFTYCSTATDVKVTGSWDNYKTSTPMYASDEDEYIALLYIPSGKHHFRYCVDGSWHCDPALPSCLDENGNKYSIIDIIGEEPVFDTMEPLILEEPLSPISSYDQSERTDFNQPIREIPSVLELQSLKSLPDDISPEVTALRSQFTNCKHKTIDNEHVLSQLDNDIPPGRTENSRFFSHVFLNHLYQAEVNKEEDDDDGQVLYLSQTTRVGEKVVNTVFVTSRAWNDGETGVS